MIRRSRSLELTGVFTSQNVNARVIIVGTGFAGLCLAIKLKAAGHDDFVVLERASEVGGTWRDNDYPGCACDIPSRLYSFSFEREADWTRDYPTQPEIYAYLRRVADDYGIREHIRFGVDVTAAHFDDATNTWRVEAADGRMFRSQIFVSAMGALSRPYEPALPGLERFAGRIFHSARWDHTFDLRAKNVAVIGTGASAIQFVPQIAPVVANLSLFQRTPPWILPKPDGPIGARERALLRRLPLYAWLKRKAWYWLHEVRAFGFTLQPRILARLETLALWWMRKQVRDPALRTALTPDYRMGCKRILLSNDYYPALCRPNVDVVTAEIAEVRSDAIVTRDGHVHPVDAVILGTGFRANEGIAPVRIFGRDGIELATRWQRGSEAYLGLSVAGFPNFFMLVGPNTGLGHNSMVFMIEAQVRYVIDALSKMKRRRIDALDVRPNVQAAFNRRLQRRMSRTVWTSGCRSWYLDANGKNTTLWPGFSFAYGLRTRHLRLRRYQALRSHL